MYTPRVLKQTLFCYLLPFIYTGEKAAFELWCELNSCTHWEGGAEDRPTTALWDTDERVTCTN